jgi:NADH-quinone oxidoreductase subunit G
VARLSGKTAAEIGLSDGDPLKVSTRHGSITLPAVITPMPDRVVWLPTNSTGSSVRSGLRAEAGSLVSIAPAGSPTRPDLARPDLTRPGLTGPGPNGTPTGTEA